MAQTERTTMQKIFVRLRNIEDLEDLSERVGVKLTPSVKEVCLPSESIIYKRKTVAKSAPIKASEWVGEWVGMPEFKQPKQEPFALITFHIDEDYREVFKEQLEQGITPKTQSLWHPKLERGVNRNKRYVYES